jgi:hypothetical protein
MKPDPAERRSLRGCWPRGIGPKNRLKISGTSWSFPESGNWELEGNLLEVTACTLTIAGAFFSTSPMKSGRSAANAWAAASIRNIQTLQKAMLARL